MTRFAFTAIPVQRSLAGAGGAAAVITGRREAADERSLREELKRTGLIAIEIRPLSVMDALRAQFASDRLRRGDSLWFFQTLNLLLSSAVPMESALSSMTELAPNPRLRRACEQIRESVRGGKPLAESVEKCAGLASPQALALLKSGHESGRLAHVVGLIESSLARLHKLRGAIFGKLAYPALVLCVALAVLWYLSVFVIPKFAEVLSSLGGELPLTTWITLHAAKWVVWGVPIVAIVLLVISAQRGRVLPTEWRDALAEKMLRWPIIGPLVWNTHGAVVCDVVGTMIEGGGDVLAGLHQAEQVVGSPVVARRVAAARQKVREGVELGEALADGQVLPPTAATVVRVGMRSGDLAGSLKRATQVCIDQQERTTQQLMVLLEPATILLMAVSVGWVIFSLVQGMMAMNQAGSL